MKATMTITMEMTAEKTGLSMKKSAFQGYSPHCCPAPSAAAFPGDRFHDFDRHAGHQFMISLHDNPFPGDEPALHYHHVVGFGTELDESSFGYIVGP